MSYPVAGIGILSLIPSGTYPKPVRIATVSDVSLSVKATTEKLFGEKKFAIDQFVKETEVSGKGKFKGFGAATLSSLLSGVVTTGMKIGITDESATIPTTPFSVTVANGATFFENLGVIDLNTGLPMTPAATATGAGVYAVNTTTGVYTFNTADVGHLLKISYSYTGAAIGQTVTISNSLMGTAATFGLRLFNNYSDNYGISLPKVVIPSLDFSFKSSGYGEMDFTFEAMVDPNTDKVAEFFFK